MTIDLAVLWIAVPVAVVLWARVGIRQSIDVWTEEYDYETTDREAVWSVGIIFGPFTRTVLPKVDRVLYESCRLAKQSSRVIRPKKQEQKS